MELQLDNCLKRETILNGVLEPHWGKITFEICPDSDNKISPFKYNTDELIIQVTTYNVKRSACIIVTILGISETLNTESAFIICIKNTIIECIRRIERLFTRYSLGNQQFNNYPVFNLIQAAMVYIKTSHHTNCVTIRHKHCSLTLSNVDTLKHLNKLTIGGQSTFHGKGGQPFEIDYDYNSILNIANSIINLTAPSEYYSEGLIIRTKASQLNE
jgi:hypothetical protein